MNLFKEFQEFVDQESLFTTQDKLLLAVSGGIDSMVLLFLLKHFQYNFEVAHANFQLRGDESKGDEQFVSDYCNSHHIPFHVKHFDTLAFAKFTGTGIQEAARKLRYTWFEELSLLRPFDRIVTAHQANDQAETILFHLMRGSGAKGLSGIQPLKERLARPLLFAKKQDLLQFAAKQSIPFRNDSSNAKEEYTRNYIRHQIIPKILQVQPAFIESSNHAGKLMAATWHYYQQEINRLEQELTSQNGTTVSIQLSALSEKPFASFLLYEFIHPLGFNLEQCEHILSSFDAGNTGSLFISSSHRALLNRDQLLIEKPEMHFHPFDILQLPFETTIMGNIYRFSESPFVEFSENSWWLDLDQAKLPFHIRTVQDGDRFKPLGLPYFQKISDYLINRKVDRFQKGKSWVIMSGINIVALIPHRVSEDFKIHSESKRFLKIEPKKGE